MFNSYAVNGPRPGMPVSEIATVGTPTWQGAQTMPARFLNASRKFLERAVKSEFPFPLMPPALRCFISSTPGRGELLLCPALSHLAELCDFGQVALPLCFSLCEMIGLEQTCLLSAATTSFLDFSVRGVPWYLLLCLQVSYLCLLCQLIVHKGILGQNAFLAVLSPHIFFSKDTGMERAETSPQQGQVVPGGPQKG